MISDNNPFKRYTLAIAEDYSTTAEKIAETQLGRPRKVYKDMSSLLQECVLLGATKYGTNFIC